MEFESENQLEPYVETEHGASGLVEPPVVRDVDHPHWGPLAGITIWLFSYIFPIFLLVPWILIERGTGHIGSSEGNDIQTWALSPRGFLASTIITFIGHLLTLLLCWAVITQLGRQGFFSTLGWDWGGLKTRSRFSLVAGVVIGVFFLQSLFRVVLPEAETTPFEEMLKSSVAVRVSIALMAVLTAPIVEEVIYRGVLYSGLCSKLGRVAATSIVALLFVLVHFQQYQGAWASLAGLFVLSLTLTLIRAIGKMLLPCFVIHLVYNLIGATFILISG